MDISTVEASLRQRLEEMQKRLDKIKADRTKSHSADFAEQAQERENDEVLDQLGNETRVAINQIQNALQRIQDGSYGVCSVCGEEIAEGRLEVLPETTRCVDCAG